MTDQQLTPRVLVIGLDPYHMGGSWDPAPVAAALETGVRRAADHGVGVQSCLFGLDGGADPTDLVTAALRSRSWECVIVGVGLRKAEDELELFERMVNLARQHAPGAAIGFNATLTDFYETAARWISVAD